MTTPEVPPHDSPAGLRRGPALPSDICSRLQRETASEHEAIEAASGILHRELTREEYRRYLERWFGFVAPLEAELERRGVWGSLGLDPTQRRKGDALERDLADLGAVPSALPLCPRPELNDVPEALGAAYVIEGSTLGGRVLSRHVQACLGGSVPRRFLEVYGHDTGERWQAFRNALSAMGGSRPVQDRMIAGARATFREFTRWLERP